METSDLSQFHSIIDLLNPGRILITVLGFIVLALVARFVEKISLQIQTSWPSRRLLALQISTVVNFAVYIFGAVLIVYVVIRPPKEIMVAIAGSAAVAIGFSLKDIVASIVAGVILLFDRPFQVGDRVTFAGQYGEIVTIGLRAVKLLTLDETLVTIPNSRFLTDTVASGNAGALDMMIVVDFHIALDEDIAKAREICYAVAATSRYCYIRKPIVVLANEVELSERLALRLRVKAHVLDVRYEKAFETDIVVRVAELFGKEGIRRPQRA